MKLKPLILCALIVLLNGRAFAQGESPLALFQQGHKAKAAAAFAEQLRKARETENPKIIWHALMGSAWFADETGDPRNSIIFSNEALSIASELNDPFMKGRSLCWLGWAYSSLGRYETATEFYRKAVEIGAPNGKIQIVPVWGLAAQELGAIYFKMGEPENAKALLKQTIKVARENKVLAGVAEGAAHLSEIALASGEIDSAWRWASESVQAALDCNCSPFNLARARVIKARVALERLHRKQLDKEDTTKLIDEAGEYSEKVGTKVCLAQSKILKSKLMPREDFQGRLQLLSDALVLLSESENELRGTAESQMGALFLDEKKTEYAELYIKQGLKINEEMLRTVDNAYIVTSISQLNELKNEKKESLENLKKATDLALQSGQLPLAMDNSEKLADQFYELGYYVMAHNWYNTFLKSVDSLIKKEENSGVREKLEKRKIKVMEKYAELTAELSPEKHQAIN